MSISCLCSIFLAALPLVSANILSAAHIPVELPSGASIHLDIDRVFIYESGQDFYSVNIHAQVTDIEEQKIAFADSIVPEQIKNYLQKNWYFDNFDCRCLFPLKLTPIHQLSFTPIIKPEPLPGGIISGSAHLSYLSGSTIVNSGVSQINKTDTSSSSDVLTEYVNSDTTDEKNNSSLSSEANQPTMPDNAFLLPNSAYISFSMPSNGFGRGWHVVPYELGFIKKQSLQHSTDNIEEMVLVLAPFGGKLYQRKHHSSDLYSVTKSDYALRDNLNETYTLTVPLQGEFLFNNKGQLIQSISIDGSSCSYYEYSNGNLISIKHKNYPAIFLEYDSEGKRLIGIHGLENKIRCQYDQEDLLYNISDEQGSSLHFAYDEDNRLSKISDDSGAILFEYREDFPTDIFNDTILKDSQMEDEVCLLFNGHHEIYYSKSSQNIWKFTYKNKLWSQSDEQDE